MRSAAATRVPQVEVSAVEQGSNHHAKYYLHAGQYFSSAEPTRVTTILGSCVAVCLWDLELGAGGVCHFLLPHWAGTGRVSPRFGNVAVASLVEGLVTLGCTVERPSRSLS